MEGAGEGERGKEAGIERGRWRGSIFVRFADLEASF
jgi:hypothetical protein